MYMVNGLPKPGAQEFTGKRWVVLCAGGAGWNNYPFQASIYHAYHIFINHGIPADNIIVMHPDDLASSKHNPTPGIVVNQVNGTDVYHDVPKHYIGDEVTPKNFLGVLRGDPELKAAGKLVVDGGPNDHIFVFFMGHGSVDLNMYIYIAHKLQESIDFPRGTLFAKDLINELKGMHHAQRYAKLLFYLEAIDSGSMFDKLLPADINVYAVTSSKPDQASWACCYDTVRKAYVGGHFSQHWYADNEISDVNIETIDQQFLYISLHNKIDIQNNTFEEAQHYGDLTIGQLTLSEFFGLKKQSYNPQITRIYNGQCEYVDQRDIAIHLTEQNIMHSRDNVEKLRYTRELGHILNGRRYADKHLIAMLDAIKPLTGLWATDAISGRHPLNNRDCYKKFVETFSDRCFNLSKNPYFYGKLNAFVNVCESLTDTTGEELALNLMTLYGKLNAFVNVCESLTDTTGEELALNLMTRYCEQNVHLDLNVQVLLAIIV
ncbi:unnamed protein product [Medioppia subpectinata]|uniref:Legumain prodomain domain-containing protein n=1 Tax=Medioppia subpectinata TaxID=1979941 RepID=A0A7R9KQA4_9ACAR|nr:unnamed protein product [Medioppia subpectinata]CAG2107835.1 unnamed protein product [Medioppia subpectinata]